MKQFVVIGCGRFGSSVARALYGLGHDVLAVDRDEDVIQELADSVTHAVQLDATDEAALKSLGVRNFDVAVITIGSDIQSSILITLLVKELGVDYVLAKAQNELHAKILYKTGADRVVLPEREMGVRVAHNLVSSNILDYIELAPDYSIVEITPLKGWIGKSLQTINVRDKFGVNIMAIKSKSKINISPSAQDIICDDDILVVVGNNDDIQKIEKKA
ncbi:potassium channel family protein [Geosporobacter ferrireducens]|uniref:Potassium transporter Trk n=1 Tax=Geosporobacter ferrireducens TaxID=1424294 RepID=A0A1D8GDV2_9FIRM|nr:TrkA family potassium uptake protein [Geosporobacter ferrireducens]AOT69042.1 potassium transporter Trk [Geosporobacter ferrireducens]MTI56710.1 TrkA family potassium uptake protein [Geosporobacter ferrireducens]